MRNYWEGTGELGISSESDGFDNRIRSMLRSQAATPDNDTGVMALADATASQLMCALRVRLDRMPAERRRLTANLARAALGRLVRRRARA